MVYKLHIIFILINFSFKELGSESPRKSGSNRKSKKAVDNEDAAELVVEEKGSKEESKEDDGSESVNCKEDGIAMSPSLKKLAINVSTNLKNIENPSDSVLSPASPKRTPKHKKLIAAHTREAENTEMISTQGLEQTNTEAKKQLTLMTPHRKSSRLFQKGELFNPLVVYKHRDRDDILF